MTQVRLDDEIGQLAGLGDVAAAGDVAVLRQDLGERVRPAGDLAGLADVHGDHDVGAHRLDHPTTGTARHDWV